MLLILPPRGKLIIQDQVSERIAYAPLFGLRAVSLCLYMLPPGGKLIPGHALHEKGLQRQIGVGTLVSSQEQRALLVPVTNRGSTGCQPVVIRGSTAGFVPPPVYIGFPLFVLAKSRSQNICLRYL